MVTPWDGHEVEMAKWAERMFGTDCDDVWSSERIIGLLRDRSCSVGEPWVGLDWREDHGHTDCMAMGLAAKRIEELEDMLSSLTPTDA